VAAAWRREPWAGNGGSEAVGTGTVAAAAVQRRSARFGRHPGSEADARGPRGFVFFLNYPNRLKLENWKFVPYIAPKIRNFCMWLDWDIMNNLLNCADIQFPTQTELKILDQIQHLSLWWILKGI
jgi:hypothetical protein